MGFFSSYLKKDEVEAGSPFFKKKLFTTLYLVENHSRLILNDSGLEAQSLKTKLYLKRDQFPFLPNFQRNLKVD